MNKIIIIIRITDSVEYVYSLECGFMILSTGDSNSNSIRE